MNQGLIIDQQETISKKETVFRFRNGKGRRNDKIL